MKTTTKKFYGPPGTGKTTALINLVEKEVEENNISIHSIGYLGFTNAACDEAQSRIAFQGIGTWFRTIHSSCLYLLRRNGVDKGVVTYRHRLGFCKDHGMKYSSDANDIEYGDVMPEGNTFFNIISYLKNSKLDQSQWDSTPYADDFKRPFSQLYNSWVTFKEDCHLLDFDDMLTKTLEMDLLFPTKVLFVDEFQDISPLQYDVIKHFMYAKERVYVAGDDDQAIYRFQAASPDIFLNMPADETSVLPKSYRLKKNVLDISHKLIVQNKSRKDKTFLPASDGGVVKILYHPKPEDVVNEVSGKTFLLFRTNNLVEKFSWNMARSGIPFKYLDESKEKMWGWSNDSKRELYNSLCGNYSAWNTLDRMTSSGKIAGGSASYMKLYIAKYHKPISPGAINTFMGTIHSAKGREADTVILFDTITPKVMSGITMSDTGFDDERRVFYVGMTRAKEKLVIAHAAFPKALTIELPTFLGAEK